MRHLVLVSLVLSLVLLSSGLTSDRDLLLGEHQKGERLLEQVLVERRSIFPLLKVEEMVTVKGDGYARITRIEAIDVKGNGYNVQPEIKRGGIGDTFVTLHFESERGHGIHYLVKVYAI